ncbi:hypothetical protein SAMN04488028_102173 [Reichenbachiella agariperforans]|uniref:Uncharacterized protein n=1 Tax=Reichenbachiella agariperforans TaxID=156994 RepID=A0A1M6NAE5_REIAG|nr:hypothetical protein [Reichenbachiella agariperforans]SHJ92642.1 hypothetical protein SAMN04488028_102173 [Reichenbachiella agariperforans]
MNQDPTNYLETWASIAHLIALVLVLMACINYIVYMLIVSIMGNRSGKYSFVLNNETKVMFISAIGLSIAAALVLNVFMLNERDFSHLFVFSLKSGLPVGIGITLAYAFHVYLSQYYPFILDARLADIRFRERKSPKSGRSMRLLNEEEEDDYLSEEMMIQEEQLAYDFDVWLDDISGETIIETYKGTTNRVCDKCHFRTLKLIKEEISEETMIKSKHYQCSHCGHKERVQDL